MSIRVFTRLVISIGWFLLCEHALAANNIDQLIDQYAHKLQTATQPVGLVLVVIKGARTWQRFLGETHYGNHTPPQTDTLIRLDSLSKLFTGEMLTTLASEGRLNPYDPLQKYASAGITVPKGKKGQAIQLIHLATHTSGLPREMPGLRPANAPVFSWPTETQRWQWLANSRLNATPGSRAAYSNLAFDLLADALARAGGKPYPVLLTEKITDPLGMRDTTFSPSATQCARFMQGTLANSCTDTQAADGSGGLYSTPHDMALWLRTQLYPKTMVTHHAQQMVYQRQDLRAVNGLDHAGHADAVGLGWIYLKARNGQPAILQKTGGGGSTMSYVAMNPQHHAGVFIAITCLRPLSASVMPPLVNKLLATLIN